MDHASSLDRVTPMTDKTNNSARQSVPAALQLNTNLVRTLADTRRDSAVAIASAEAELSTPSTRNYRPSVMPEAHENSALGPQERTDTQQQPGQDASMDPTTPEASDKEPKKTKKKKKKASKSSSVLCADQPQTSSPTVEDTSQLPLPGTGATPTKQLLFSTEDQGRSAVVESNNQPLTEESLEWIESAVVRGDTKPTGKRSKTKKKSTAKKARDCHTSSTPSSIKGEALSDNEREQQQEQEQEEQEYQTIHERTSADSSVPTLTISPSRTSSPSHDDSAVLTPKDDLAFLEDDLFGNGGSGNWADDVDEYVCQTTGSAASITASNIAHSSLSSIAPSSSKDVPTIADSSTNAPQESSSTTAMVTSSKQPSQDIRRSGTADERMDRAPWSHSRKNHHQQQQQPHSPIHHHHHNQNDSTVRHSTQEQYRPHPTRHQEHNKQHQHKPQEGSPFPQKPHQRSHQPRSSHARHPPPTHSTKPHEDHPPSHQLGARSERSSSSGSKAAGNISNRRSKQMDPSPQHKQPNAENTPGEEWDGRHKILQLLTSRWNAALASVGKEDTDSAVYYSSS